MVFFLFAAQIYPAVVSLLIKGLTVWFCCTKAFVNNAQRHSCDTYYTQTQPKRRLYVDCGRRVWFDLAHNNNTSDDNRLRTRLFEWMYVVCAWNEAKCAHEYFLCWFFFILFVSFLFAFCIYLSVFIMSVYKYYMYTKLLFVYLSDFMSSTCAMWIYVFVLCEMGFFLTFFHIFEKKVVRLHMHRWNGNSRCRNRHTLTANEFFYFICIFNHYLDIFGLFISALWQQKFSNFIKNWTRIKFYKNEDEYILKYLSVFFCNFKTNARIQGKMIWFSIFNGIEIDLSISLWWIVLNGILE